MCVGRDGLLICIALVVDTAAVERAGSFISITMKGTYSVPFSSVGNF